MNTINCPAFMGSSPGPLRRSLALSILFTAVLAAGPLAQAIPSVSMIDPTTGATIGTNTLSIMGSNFGTNGTVTLGGATCSIISWSNTVISCIVPAGQGMGLPLVVTVDGVQSLTYYGFSYLSPSVETMDPGSGVTQGGTYNVVYGSNFGTNATVTLGGNTCPVISCAHTQLTCRIPPGQGTNIPLVVTVSGQLDGSYKNFSYEPSDINNVNPPFTTTMGGATKVIAGHNFGTNASVTLGGSTCPVISCAHTQLTCIIASGQGNNIPLIVTVGGQAGLPYSVNYPAPYADLITPGSGATAGGSTNVVAGSNFGTNAVVTLGGTACPVISCAHTQLVILAAPGQGMSLPLTVTVSGQSSPPLSGFSYSAPVVGTMTPNSGGTEGGSTHVIYGSNFGTNATVTLGGAACTVLSCAHTQLTCLAAQGQGTNIPVLVTVSGQSDESHATFNYLPSMIVAVNPMAVSTLGGTTNVLYGFNFGTNATVTLAAR